MRSIDGGMNWAGPFPLRYSLDTFNKNEGRAVFTEKAIVTDAGALVLFHLISDIARDALWEPYFVPTSTRSLDSGHTWSNPIAIGTEKGRIFSAIYEHGRIYALKFDNDTEDGKGVTPDHVYRLFESRDDGLSFEDLGVLPFDTFDRCYGTLAKLKDGRLIVYIYNKQNEHELEYCTSPDHGRSWDKPKTAYFAKKMRNPQMIAFGGGFFMHGRSGSYGDERGNFVLYYSEDGIRWDEGTVLAVREHGQGAYSNSLVVRPSEPGAASRLRIHASHAYAEDKTNVLSWWIDLAEQV